MRQQILAIAFTAMVSSIGMASAEIYRSSRSACGGAECACRKERDAGEGLEGANRMVESEPRWRFAGNRWDRQSTSPSGCYFRRRPAALFHLLRIASARRPHRSDVREPRCFAAAGARRQLPEAEIAKWWPLLKAANINAE
jgi:hypothetical protein